MARKKKAITVPLETIGTIPDATWERLQLILAQTYPPKPTGRGRIDFRKAIDGIIFGCARGVSGIICPRYLAMTARFIGGFNAGWTMRFSSSCGPSCWKNVMRWSASSGSGRRWMGVWAKPALGKKTGPNPTDRGKSGTKKSLLLKGPAGR